MNVNSMTNSSYLSQIHSKFKTQSQDAAAGNMAQKDSQYDSLMQQVGTSVMAMLDTDKSGAIDKAEFSAIAQQLSHGKDITKNADNAFNLIDKNKDGSIDPAELMAILEQLSTKNKAQQMSAKLENSVTNQAVENKEEPNKGNLQSALMKNALSAYSSTHIPVNSNGVNLKA